MLRSPGLKSGPWIMGIVNVTPDSFSGDGAFAHEKGRSPDGRRESITHAAFVRGMELLEEGADIIDVGGESTRPGAAPVDTMEEMRRVLPVVGMLARDRAKVSIDTKKPEVARAAIGEGATIWNDVNGLRADGAPELAAALGCTVIAMHMHRDPRTMQADPHYENVVTEVADFLAERVRALKEAGVEDVWVDPGIGFGKTLDHNLSLLRCIPELRARTGERVLIGVSRKSFIGKLEAREHVRVSKPGTERIGGSLAAALFAAQNGADMLRVHDVAATVQALRVARAIGDIG